MSTVLVAVDGSASAVRAVEHAALLAKRAAAEVCVLNVQLPIRAGELVDRAALDKYQRGLGQQIVDTAMATLRDRGVAHQGRVVIGEIGESIVSTAQDLGAEQIVMGSRGMSALPNLVLGSNATRVIHLARVPVTIVK
ncbi:MAG TPA: universal stress protein [Burkholderiales bacterium]|jgi:nucleotide-binding universal stress UspA family protein